jgi:dephospho-CoA kinase
MIKVGVTGGIGSGKSLICKVFEKLGVPVYYADVAARDLSESDQEIKKCLIFLMGEDIYEDNSLNRPKMASLIFNNKQLLNSVNQIFSQKMRDHFASWCNGYTHYPYLINESAILFESKMYLLFDKIITISAPEEIRIQRVMTRQNMNRDKIKVIMQNQLSEIETIQRSHYVIINDGLSLVLPQIIQIHKSLMTDN